MPTQWQDQYTDLSNVNNGNELQNGDDILAEHVNVALENSAYVKREVDCMKLYEHRIIISGNNLTLKSNYGSTTESVTNNFICEIILLTNSNTQLTTLSALYSQALTSGIASKSEYNQGGFVLIKQDGTIIKKGQYSFSRYNITSYIINNVATPTIEIYFATPELTQRLVGGNFYYYLNNDNDITITDSVTRLFELH